jgi:purine-binding chemotaxis protein CheW
MSALNHLNQTTQFLTFYVEEHLFGINILNIRDVLFEQSITAIPLAQSEVMGAINLRGNIVTVLSMRRRLGLDDFLPHHRKNHIIIQYKDEFFDLAVDRVGEVLTVEPNSVEKIPLIVNVEWQKMMIGIVKQKDSILSLLNTDQIISLMLPPS